LENVQIFEEKTQNNQHTCDCPRGADELERFDFARGMRENGETPREWSNRDVDHSPDVHLECGTFENMWKLREKLFISCVISVLLLGAWDPKS
jgi:hypothetical protein